MRFPFAVTTRDRLDIIERMEKHMGEGFVKRGEHYLDPGWDPRENEEALTEVADRVLRG